MYVEQPEGYEKKSKTGDKLMCKLKKSLNGLKQSARNQNAMLHARLTENSSMHNPADNCVYAKKNGEKVVLIIWVDDLIIAANNERMF